MAYLKLEMEEYLFNVDNGYLEGLVRGFRSGILSRTDYINLVQCETIEGRLALASRLSMHVGKAPPPPPPQKKKKTHTNKQI